MRREIAVLTGVGIGSWWDVSRVAPSVWRIVSAASYPVSGVESRIAEPVAFETPQDLVLADARIHSVRVLDHHGFEVVHAVGVGTVPDPVDAVAESLAVTAQPSVASEKQVLATRSLFGSGPRGERLVLEVFDAMDRIEVSQEGLVRCTGRADHPSVLTVTYADTNWRTVDSVPIDFDRVQTASAGDTVSGFMLASDL